MTKTIKLYSGNIFYLAEVVDDFNQLDKLESILDAKILNEEYTGQLIGPHLTFNTPWSSNVLQIVERAGIKNIYRIEKFEDKITIDFDPMLEAIYHNTNIDLSNKETVITESKIIEIDDIKDYLIKNSLSNDEKDAQFYIDIFKKLNRPPTEVELFDLTQSNSEHSRHWFFRGRIISEDGKSFFEDDKSLMKIVSEPLEYSSKNSTVCMNDNASSMLGTVGTILKPSIPSTNSPYILSNTTYNPTFTAETHNFPTGIAPFPGAATGTGGRIRDTISIGKGGSMVAGTAGYCVGKLFTTYYKKMDCHSPEHILLRASDGASDYGNKIGEPLIQGFARDFSINYNNKHIEWLKPIMFSGGIGVMNDNNNNKEQPEKYMLIIRIGGPAYKIGIGGGSASSKNQSSSDYSSNIMAVQRGDPQVENKVVRVIHSLSNLDKNPIISIHDQGAGGMGNVTKEIVEKNGGTVDLAKVNIGDNTMNSLEIWSAEYQEQVTILIKPNSLDLVESICIRENVNFSNIGYVNNDGVIRVIDSRIKDENKQKVVDLPLSLVLENVPRRDFIVKEPKINNYKNIENKHLLTIDNLDNLITIVFNLVSVGSKRFLTNKVDRSVSGLIAQQQCVGPFGVPIADYSLVAHNYFSKSGTCSAIGEKPILSIYNPSAMARMSVGEMLTNMMFCKITQISDIKCSANWMWPGKINEHGYTLCTAAKAMSDIMSVLSIAIDGGKDSLSMSVSKNGEKVDAPGSLVISGYAMCPDISNKIQPYFSKENTNILLVDLGFKKNRMNGSALYSSLHISDNECPDVDNPLALKNIFNMIQELITDNVILSGHDRSDGGLITTLIEMSIASGIGFSVNFKENIIETLFSEELGLVIEVNNKNLEYVMSCLKYYAHVYKIGQTLDSEEIKIYQNNKKILDWNIKIASTKWEETSFTLEKMQRNIIEVSNDILSERKRPNYYLSNELIRILTNKQFNHYKITSKQYDIAIIREEGSNGDKEMAAAFYNAGFQPWDIHMNDLMKNPGILDRFTGIALVGGFSFSDALGAGKGWEKSIKSNTALYQSFNRFYKKEYTFSLGVCNGCQLMCNLNWVNGKMSNNNSNMFESRFSTVKILKTNSIMLKNMENSILGVWIAHGEGKFNINETNKSNIPIKYSDDDGFETNKYPYCPNGSSYGAAALISDCGRHLAMMPHPERCFINWQNPWYPKEWNNIFSDNKNKHWNAPWSAMFKNAYDWCKMNENELNYVI